MQPGDSYTFKAKVDVIGSTNNGALWSVMGASSTSTSIDGNGRLTIGNDETSSKIYVKAVAQADATKMDSATVAVQVFNSIHVNFVSGSKEPNGSFILKATVGGTNVDSASTADQQVKWNIVEGSRNVAQIGANTFKISAAAEKGTKLSFTATSMRKPTLVSAPFTVVVEENGNNSDDPINDPTVNILDTDWPEFIDRGGSGTVKVELKNAAGKTLKYVVEMREGKQKTWGEGSLVGKTGYSTDISGTSCKVSVLKTFAYDKEATVWVRAYLLSPGQSIDKASPILQRSAYVNPVSMNITRKKDKSGMAKTLGEKLEISYRKGSERVYYELLGIKGTDVKWKIDNSKILKITQDKDYFAFSAPDLQASGETKAYAYVGSYYLGCMVEVTLSPGNIRFITGTNTNTGGGSLTNEVWAYLPLPTDPDIQDKRDKYYNKVKGDCGNNDNAMYNWKLSGAGRDNYFKLDNLSNVYCYYFYRQKIVSSWSTATYTDEEYRVIIRDTIINASNNNGDINQFSNYGASKITYCCGNELPHTDWSGTTILRFRPGIDKTWVAAN